MNVLKFSWDLVVQHRSRHYMTDARLAVSQTICKVVKGKLFLVILHSIDIVYWTSEASRKILKCTYKNIPDNPKDCFLTCTFWKFQGWGPKPLEPPGIPSRSAPAQHSHIPILSGVQDPSETQNLPTVWETGYIPCRQNLMEMLLNKSSLRIIFYLVYLIGLHFTRVI